MSATIAVRFVGGAYDGQTERVAAVEDALIGDYPVLHTVYRAVPPQFSLVPRDPGEVLSRPPDLAYRREHRGGAWAYVLYGSDESQLPVVTDPLLEAFVAHVRREWPARQVLTGREVCVAERRLADGFDQFMESSMLTRMHREAAERGCMVVLVDGPRWESPPGDDFTTTCTIRATVVPQFGGKPAEDAAPSLLDEQRYVPPVDGVVPEVVASWGPQSQLRWFAEYRGQLRWQWPTYWERFYIDSELHKGRCCSSCLADIEEGYDEPDPERCCCAAVERRTSA